MDELTGDYYLRARYYRPSVGRFLQEDVIYDDRLNLYAYCGSNPIIKHGSLFHNPKEDTRQPDGWLLRLEMPFLKMKIQYLFSWQKNSF